MHNPALAIGDTVRIIHADYPSQAWLEGAEFPVQEEHRENSPYVLVPGVGSCHCQWEFISPEVVALTAEIETLTRLNQVQAQRITTLLDNEHHNSKVLSSNFRRLKEAHNWCDEAHKEAKDMNSMFLGALEIDCEDEYEVTVTVRAYFEYEHTTTVMACSQEEANELVEEDASLFVDEYSLNEAHSYEGWTNIEYELY